MTLRRQHPKWGTDWLEHDGESHDPKRGTNVKKLPQALGFKVQITPESNAEPRIKAGRMMFSWAFMDTSKFDTPPERPDRLLGAGHLMERLNRYKRNVPRTPEEPAGPEHDIASHGADAFGGLAEIVDRIRNEGGQPTATVKPFENVDAAMGLLG